jgi:hypothetical protein
MNKRPNNSFQPPHSAPLHAAAELGRCRAKESLAYLMG